MQPVSVHIFPRTYVSQNSICRYFILVFVIRVLTELLIRPQKTMSAKVKMDTLLKLVDLLSHQMDLKAVSAAEGSPASNKALKRLQYFC